MFDTLRIPSVQGRTALLIINCQDDVYSDGGSLVPNPPDFLDRIRKTVPHYRKAGTDIIWVKTQPKSKPGTNGTASNGGVRASDTASPALKPDDAPKTPAQPEDGPDGKTSKNDHGFVEELCDLFDPQHDVVILKKTPSAFDGTPLLMALRMKMVTNIHLCGGLSNSSILHTASDAAQHGFEVSVLEDCMGYRNEEQHIQAMKKMADNIGVLGVDSEEIVEAAGGRPPPDADPSLFLGPGISGINISAAGVSLQNTTQDSSNPASSRSRNKNRGRWQTEPHTGVIAEGDSSLHTDLLSAGDAAGVFAKLRSEITWQTMMHRSGEVPRRIAVQGEVEDDGAVPVYRHPADESPPLTPFTDTVRKIRDACEKLLGQKFNHVLVQLYRDGQDNISEHSDKTLDIVRDSSIVNVSFGAQRTMTLRLKKSALPARTQRPDIASPHESPARQAQRIPLPHNSVFVLGWQSNARWLHGIRADKRLDAERSDPEKAYGGERISLTFRDIGTWTDPERTRIWGQGAKGKSQAEAGRLLSGDADESERMVRAFGHENQQSTFDWDAEYGRGFDVLDLVTVNRPDDAAVAA